ncbi:hypothetical protein TRICI_004119 [Trichomonascus ciferrii]|uniref:Carboxypeptidase n=1 Tax=Trichomonascus ciferrii TaxID=44093 RepID=A0A642V207_9ASCO|nr:hypothetical protein TRICI_004119 [Trichomonascus ciferrii]
MKLVSFVFSTIVVPSVVAGSTLLDRRDLAYGEGWETFAKRDIFPDHELRVREVKDLGVDKVKQYSGYLDVNNKQDHLFYWFFESRGDPSTDPTVLWLNGGPGCSSLEGLFFENGPASIDANLKPKHNPYSWNSNANVIFVDQPINTGFSYSARSVSNTPAAAEDMAAFLELFFQKFPKYKNEFHISGESYAGHYIPVLATTILGNRNTSFNLTSVLIGNGLTDPLTQYNYYQPMACGEGGYKSVLSTSACSRMKQAITPCVNSIQRCYENPNSRIICQLASAQCQQSQLMPYQQTGLNVYDVRTKCDPDTNGLCYKALDNIKNYLNQPNVKQALGARTDINYDLCNQQINLQFQLNGDWMQPIQRHVTRLLEQEIPVLIYAGDKDYICNWLGNRAWTRALPWKGHDQFQAAKIKAWEADGSKAGEVINHQHFTFLRIYNAGHLAPYDQPKNSLAMLNTWLDGKFDFSNSTAKRSSFLY